jgi:hypothetical protein
VGDEKVCNLQHKNNSAISLLFLLFKKILFYLFFVKEFHVYNKIERKIQRFLKELSHTPIASPPPATPDLCSVSIVLPFPELYNTL